MVNVSTLFYVLENLEGKSTEVIDLEEIQELEEKVLDQLLGMIDYVGIKVPDSVLENILQSTGTH